ncbi:MAG: sortase [Caldilineaceae bacterium]
MVARLSTARSRRLCGRTASLLGLVSAAALLMISGCTPIQPPSADSLSASSIVDDPAAAATESSTEPSAEMADPSAGAVVTATNVVTVPAALTATVVATESAQSLPPAGVAVGETEASVSTADAAATEPLAGAEAVTATADAVAFAPLTATVVNAPVILDFPEIGVTVPVAPMGWEVVRTDAGRTTRWLLPPDAAGWHPDSAEAGAPGNTIISGSQLAGAAVFAPLALGEVTVGQEILLTDAAGATLAYTVVELSEPLAIEGDAAANAALLRYLQPDVAGAANRLTLLTGWPDFTTTHRVVVVAEPTAP